MDLNQAITPTKGGIMSNNTRREHLKTLLGMAALGRTPLAVLAAFSRALTIGVRGNDARPSPEGVK
jgi:hypothetical protein